MKRYLNHKAFWFSSFILLALVSCKNTEKQNTSNIEDVQSIEIQESIPDTFSGEIPQSIEVEINTDGNDYYEIKHQSANQSKVDSIKNKKNKQKQGKK